MPDKPHQYTVRAWNPHLESEFCWVVAFIREKGTRRKFGKYRYTYWEADGWEYWSMGWPIHMTTIVNRARARELPQLSLFEGQP